MVVYNQDTKGAWRKIKESVDGREEEVMIIGGDWNARTGEEGGPINEDLGKEKNRQLKDKTINMEGRTLLKYLEEKGWTIIDGRHKEVEERTCIGERGNSVIDYVIGNQEAIEKIIDMKVGKRTESDHMPLEIEIGGQELRINEEKEEEKKEKGEWTNESVEKYLEECKDWTCNGRTVKEMWTEIKRKINEAMSKKKVKIRKWDMGEKVWCNKEWKERKKEMRKRRNRAQREEEELRKGQVGGIVVGERKVWSLTYADDIVLMMINAKEIRKIFKGNRIGTEHGKDQDSSFRK
ncbi:uncharacterized protein LOC117238880 [Bombus vosnesenskii]|uniref:Uncharacterized protein LOC117238880 n=1 Tax=Bombus vosnesenskii TaxID=207650 RepID=A0A6J3L3X1_9HYME|nr:uncharacterized protein LOC117238880 [Bombus vosnesenskii]